MISPNKPSIVRKDMDVVLTCMVSESVGPGEDSLKMVKSIGKDLGYYSGIGFADVQRCLETALQVLEVEAGDRVALSPLSPFWYQTVLTELGIVPVYWDVNPDTCLPKFEEGFEKGLKAVIYHHHLGIPGNLGFWSENEIPVIEDITEIIGGAQKKEVKEPQGNLAILDLGEDGHFTAGGGGLLLSLSKKEHAIVKSVVANYSPLSFLSDLNAVFGASQWSRIDRFTKKREEILEIYKAALLKSRHKGFVLDDDIIYVPTSFPVLLSTGGKETFSYTKKKKISCVHTFESSIFSHFDLSSDNLPGAKQLSLRCVRFPLYPALTNGNVDLISKVLASLP